MTYLDDNYLKWCDQWEAAQKSGLFEAPKKDHVPSAALEPESFFGGFKKNAPSETVKDADGKYWNDLYRLSRDYGNSTDTLDDYLNGDLMQETVTEKAPKAPNPVTRATVGKDQNAAAVGVHYDVDNFQGLESLKLKLHGLLDKLNGMDSKGESTTKLETQIVALEKQIDELSNNIGLCKNESVKRRK